MLDGTTPHVAVPVQAIRGGEVIATVLSDGSGRYQFTDLKPGEYQVRCQVLGGYVYYGEEKAGKPESSFWKKLEQKGGEGRKAGSAIDKPIGLQIKPGETFENVDFCFAPFKKGTWKNHTIEGLGHKWVTAIYRDPDGMMWFGTHGGVSRYDGKTFVNFTTKDGLAHDTVYAIHRDPDGVVWFGTFGGGVSRYDGETFVNFTTKDGLADDRVRVIYRDPDGMMWFGTEGGGVSRYDGVEFVNFTTENGLANNSVRAIHRDPGGAMCFWTSGGVSRFDGKEFVNLTTEADLEQNYWVHAFHFDPDGVMWFGTLGEGIFRYDGRKLVNLTTEDGLAHNRVLTIHRDPDGVMWFGTEGGGVSRYDGRTFVNFTEADGLAGNRVRIIHQDPDSVMWFGTEDGGVSRYDAKTFISLTKRDGLVYSYFLTIHREPDGVMWFGTSDWPDPGNGVYRYDGKIFVHLTTKDGLAHDSIYAIHRDPDGVMWFGTRCGVSRYNGKEFVNFTTKDGLADDIVSVIHRDPDGMMWFGTDRGGVSRYDGEEFVNFTTEHGLANNKVCAIHRDPDDMIWFGTFGGISRYDGETFVNFTTKDGLADDRVRVIYRDPDGMIWFGTEDCLSCYDGVEFVNFTTEDGLAYNVVYAIHRDSDGVMWFGTWDGVSKYDGTAWSSLDIRDGLAGNRVTSILQDPDGSIRFKTQGGIKRYRRSTTPPKVRIVSVTTDQTYRLKTHDSRFKTEESIIPAFTPGTRVTVEYSSIDFKTLPEKRQYRCRIRQDDTSRVTCIEDADPDWHKPTKEISFDWIPKKPGTYTFEVQAIDRDLNYSEPASVKLEVISDPRNHRIIQLEAHIREQELAEMERVHQELEDARQIQQSLLPGSPPEMEGFEVAATSLPAREVSGDFYNYLTLGKNTGIVLADVTGKSVKAAMVSALANGTLNAEIRDRADVWNSPGSILRQLNIDLQPHLIRGMYTAMSLGIIQPEQKRLIFSNAGMPYPIVRRGREVWELEVNGMPLGLIDKAEYQDLNLDLKEKLVIFYSDGVIEAENGAGEMYQIDRLLEVVQEASPAISAQEMVDLIVNDVTAFVGDEEAYDDITIVVIRCRE